MIKQIILYTIVALYIVVTGSLSGGSHVIQSQAQYYQQKESDQ